MPMFSSPARWSTQSIHKRNHGRTRLSLHIERLESRWAMAGNITASVDANGDLFITGDSLSNTVLIRGTGNPGELTVDALEDDLQNDTTLNGGTGPITFTGVTGS